MMDDAQTEERETPDIKGTWTNEQLHFNAS